MPNCGRVQSVHYAQVPGGWQLAAEVQPGRMLSRFQSLIQRALPIDVEVNQSVTTHSVVVSARRGDVYAPTRAFLELLGKSVTIDDEADSSHALGLHRFADIEERSILGDLVQQAKDYGLGSPSDPQAVEQLRQASLDWLTSYFPIQSIDAVAAIPGTQAKSFDLPAAIADAICLRFGKKRAWLRSRNQTPQKGRADSSVPNVNALSAMMNADRDVFGKRLLLVDDLYRSGDTMMAGVKTLRRAGATAVHCLSLTKTAKHCNGLPATVDNWPDWHPDATEIDRNDLPFC